MKWAEIGKLYVRSLTTKRGETDLTLWFLTSRGDGSTRHIARHDPHYSRDYPTRYEDEGYIGCDDAPTGVTGSGSAITNHPATDDEIKLFTGGMVTLRRVRPDSLPLDRWVEMGLLPEEAERIRRVWERR